MFPETVCEKQNKIGAEYKNYFIVMPWKTKDAWKDWNATVVAFQGQSGSTPYGGKCPFKCWWSVVCAPLEMY